jgi:metal-responsive CopG/Arc/MetJ family transcriptional regulator
MKEPAMTAITVTLPPDVVERIDQLRELELLSRSNWLRREIVMAVRANLRDRLDEAEPQGTA